VSGPAPLEVVVAPDAQTLAAMAAERLALALVERAGASPATTLSVALAGGRTPRAASERLARDDRVPWSRLAVFLGDERCVPPDDARSNAALLRETLVDGGPLPPSSLRAPWTGRRADGAALVPGTAEFDAAREAAARAYEAQLPERLDLLLLGVGADGHVASLFPESPALGLLAPGARRVVPASAPTAPHERLTITPAVIVAARRLFVLVSGADKADAVARALDDAGPAGEARASGWVRALPARLARRGTWLIDRAAAAKLGRR
jgi:6-phosphogluconolactonase